ncbi:hypothetical protein Glove_443g62 [Diversispora epigaea]|uniref:Epoxide hydrolase N-terminal domain-containing protein n=1 Tax=Diversispora epigaea TaxID=1348612 RepID=A0A397GUU1_9GLOM|nr:hypothetical protein Glove_443g62 [Diversispora epigaea]
METYKAIIFDIGGVCVGSPLEGIAQYERKHNLPPNFINVSISKAGENGAFQRLERGEITVHEFLKIFSEEMSNPKNKELYLEYLLLRGDKTISNETSIFPATITIEGKELFQIMIAKMTKLNPIMFKAIKKLKASNKFKIVALTNNFQFSNEDSQIMEPIGGNIPLELKNLFDEYIESSIIGMRKPDPKIFLYTCNKLKIEPKEAIFLDDIGINLKSAKNLGMKTIKVELNNSEKAIKELEKSIGISLLNNDNKLKL